MREKYLFLLFRNIFARRDQSRPSTMYDPIRVVQTALLASCNAISEQ